MASSSNGSNTNGRHEQERSEQNRTGQNRTGRKRTEQRRLEQRRSRRNKRFDVSGMISRQRWLLAFLGMLGAVIGTAYALNAEIWYQSRAKVLISQKSAGLGDSTTGQLLIDDATLANHVSLIASRLIVGDALKNDGLLELESITERLDEKTDVTAYVIDHLRIDGGGAGSAKGSHSLNVQFIHTDPEDTQLVLASVMRRYEKYIIDQIQQVMGLANSSVQNVKKQVEEELRNAEQEHLISRKEAPLFTQDSGSSNLYLDHYRRLHDEMLELDIRESELRTRLKQVQDTLSKLAESDQPVDQLDKLAVIDAESLERLGVFAGLQASAAKSPEMLEAIPAKAEEARTQITGLMKLNTELDRLTAIFGPKHPKVREVQSQIELVKKFINENDALESTDEFLDETQLSTEGLLRAYVGFVEHDLAALAERRRELQFLTEDAKKKAKEFQTFELLDVTLVKKIERQQQLYETIEEQLRDLDTASGLSGYLYEFLEVPRVGERSWPSLSLCGFGGAFLGLCLGFFGAFFSELRDRRFRSAEELDNAIGLTNLGRVGMLNSIDMGVEGLVAAESSPDAEAFRLGRTVLLRSMRAGQLKTIGFTSPMQGDGKSTVTSNFAVCFSQLDLKTIVVDADLRRPSVDRYFSVAKTGGLCDVLEQRLSLDDVIKETDVDNVNVITAGSSTERPAELLQSPLFDDLLDELKQRYDVVLVDLPPALAVSDPAVVMPRLDGGVLVVRVARARRDEVLNTIRRITSSGGEFVGCMLNAVGADDTFDGIGGYFGYYESDYTRKESSNGQSTHRKQTKSKSRNRIGSN